ncbi:hypothetical protein C0J52_24608, partial [Blattella germanica]
PFILNRRSEGYARSFDGEQDKKSFWLEKAEILKMREKKRTERNDINRLGVKQEAPQVVNFADDSRTPGTKSLQLTSHPICVTASTALKTIWKKSRGKGDADK